MESLKRFTSESKQISKHILLFFSGEHPDGTVKKMQTPAKTVTGWKKKISMMAKTFRTKKSPIQMKLVCYSY